MGGSLYIWGTFMKRKKITLFLLLMGILLALGGCKKELTKEEVQETEYYQKLEKKNKKLKNNVTSLEDEVKELTNELLELKEQLGEKETNQSTLDYLEKIKDSSITQVEVEYTDRSTDSVFLKNKAVCKYVKQLLQKADLTVNYTPEDLRTEMGRGYLYTLYEEDGSIFQAEVYGDGYVIFPDLPGQVYYCMKGTSFGEAFLVRKGSYPNSNLLHRMADSALVIYGEKKVWDQTKCLEAANHINTMAKREVGTNRESEVKKEYKFYSYGNEMILRLYKSHICIIAWDGEESWFQVSKEDIAAIKSIFS